MVSVRRGSLILQNTEQDTGQESRKEIGPVVRYGRVRAFGLLLAGILSSLSVDAYESEIHQQLTFIAARQYNACVQTQPATARLSALDSRYIVKANIAQAEGGFFGKMFRWPYYNRDDQTNQSSWLIFETRFHSRFAQQLKSMAVEDRRQQLRAVGRVVSHVQDVTSPAHVVPVYTGRWWRFSLTDRFNRYPIDAPRVEAAVALRCSEVLGEASAYSQLLIDTAEATLQAVRSPIYDYPTTWESFWKLADEADQFGEYGPAGNTFGDRTQFRCGASVDGKRETCLLLNDDPLYRDFAHERHVDAVMATMRVMYLFQTQEVNTTPRVLHADE